MGFLDACRGRAAACAIVAAGVIGTAPAVLADQVALKSADGTVNLVGEFVEFRDGNYIIRTQLGDLRISAARVRCEGDACPNFEDEGADVRFAGTDTIGTGLMPLLLTGYAAALDAEASITSTGGEGEFLAELIGDSGYGDPIGSYFVSSSSTSEAFRALIANQAQIGMASRRILPAEARALRDAGAGDMINPDQEHLVAVDSLVVVTHPSNPVSTLSLEQLGQIYSGRIRNWSQVGGPDAPITVVNRAEDSAARADFEAAVFGGPARRVQGHVIAEDNNNMAALVNGDPAAIGFVGHAFQRGAKPVTLIDACGLPSEPDAFSAKTEEYPLQRRLYLYNRADMRDAAGRNFLDFAMSGGADGVIAKSGFIDLGVMRKPQEMSGARAMTLLTSEADPSEGRFMRDMLAQMLSHDRLSTTFRFRTGSSSIDERGQADLKRLVEYLEAQDTPTELLFVGFTDNVGAFNGNLNLSVERARRVIGEVQAAAGGRLDHVAMTATGYGEIAPTGCNATNLGRSTNRRVEVWVKARNAS